MPRISIDPITRLEGHGKIAIFLDDNGDVKNAYLQIPELRGFERFCVGRNVEDLPNLTSRICGVCPEAHHIAGTKALDKVFHVDPPPTAKKLRELFYSIFYATDHTTHFYALGGPDFVCGPDAPPAERNIIGVIKKVGMDVGGKVINMRKTGHDLIQMIGGRRVHPNWGLPGGVSKGINEEQRKIIEAKGREAVEFAQFSLKVFDDLVLANSSYLELIEADMYVHKTYNMGMVDAQNHVNFYDGMIRVTSPSGKEHAKYNADQYCDYIAEHVEPWSYLKFPYLKKVGWKGFVDGEDSGVYKATSLSRCNVADGMATPLAQKEWQRDVRHARRQARAPHACDALGSPGRDALRDRALGRVGHRSSDHRQRIPHSADGHADRRRRLRRGSARHVGRLISVCWVVSCSAFWRR